MVIISRYRFEKRHNVYIVRSKETNLCPVCSGALKVIGSRKRKIICDEGAKTWTLIIRRLRCHACGAIHHELPDIVVPYKRHCVKTIEKIIGGDYEGICCEESTIRRIRAWWASYRLRFESVIVSPGTVGFCKFPSLKKIIKTVTNANLWIHTCSAFLDT